MSRDKIYVYGRMIGRNFHRKIFRRTVESVGKTPTGAILGHVEILSKILVVEFAGDGIWYARGELTTKGLKCPRCKNTRASRMRRGTITNDSTSLPKKHRGVDLAQRVRVNCMECGYTWRSMHRGTHLLEME